MIYEKLRFLAQVVLPILGTLYFALAGILNLPAVETVIGIIMVIDAVLGVVLYISNKQHNTDGVIEVFQSVSGKKTYTLNLNGDPEDIDKQDEIVFKVKKLARTSLTNSQAGGY